MLVLLLLTTIINFFNHRTNIQKAREVKFSQRPYLNLRKAINLGLRTCLTYTVLPFFRWGHCLLILMCFLARFLWETMENNFYKVVKLYLNGRDSKSHHIYHCFTSWPNQHSTDLPPVPTFPQSLDFAGIYINTHFNRPHSTIPPIPSCCPHAHQPQPNLNIRLPWFLFSYVSLELWGIQTERAPWQPCQIKYRMPS